MLRISQDHCHQFKEIIFDRLNSKYNRLWEQITAVSVLTIEVLVAYIIGILAYDASTTARLLRLNYASISIIGVTILLSLAVALLFYEKESTRIELKRFLLTLEESMPKIRPSQ